jgi:hypothetical protein
MEVIAIEPIEECGKVTEGERFTTDCESNSFRVEIIRKVREKCVDDAYHKGQVEQTEHVFDDIHAGRRHFGT